MLPPNSMAVASGLIDTGFFVWAADKTVCGPIELPELVAWARAERVTPETWIFANKSGSWQRALDVPELQWFFQVKHTRPLPPDETPPNPRGFDSRNLRRLKLFAAMTDEQLDRFAQFMEVSRFPLGSTIVRQGDRGDAMFLILEGELSVRMRVAGHDTTLATLGVGDFFGDIALFDHGPRSTRCPGKRPTWRHPSCERWARP
jgi:hypothetical protein